MANCKLTTDFEATSGLLDVELDKRIEDKHLDFLAPHFGSPMNFVGPQGFGLVAAERADVRREAQISNKLAMLKALRCWLNQDPLATFRSLLKIVFNTKMNITSEKKEIITTLCKTIKTLRVHCNNLDNGCQWTGKLGELKTHLQSCVYALLPCPNKCTFSGTQGEVTKWMVKDIKKSCDKQVSKAKI